MIPASLHRLPLRSPARIVSVGGEDSLTARLMEMGLLEGISIEAIGAAPFGDPREYLIRGSRISLRSTEADRIAVEVL